MPEISTPEPGSSLRDWVLFVEKRLRAAKLHYGHGTQTPRDEAVWLVASIGNIPFESIETLAEKPLAARAASKSLGILKARIATRKPLAYLLREAWLAGEQFYVDERVIVPRSYIAELLPGGFKPSPLPAGPTKILDLCTGSGCLAVLAAQRFPKARVDAVDVSAGAISVARRNVTLHQLATRVQVVRGDLFDPLRGKRYDLILCNPPYVDDSSMRGLPSEYRHEPHLALAGGKDGLDLVYRILREASHHLTPRGIIVVEIGHNRRALERRLGTKKIRWLATLETKDKVMLATHQDLDEWMLPLRK